MVVQIISGFRGSGKTTFLNQCIEQVKGKTAVIQNDFGAQAVDRENAEGSLIYEEIGEGCICCGMALEFEEKMRRIAMEDCPDRIFIEASGFGKLSDVVKVCTQLKEKDHLEMMIGPNVTVVDIGMVEAYASGLGEFYVDQIKHADAILINHIDAEEEEPEEIAEGWKVLKRLNTKALKSEDAREVLKSVMESGSVDQNLQIEGDTLIKYLGADAFVEVPDGIRIIADSAFEYCMEVQEVHLPDSVERIGKHAFQGSGIKKIHLPESIKTIDIYAFSGTPLEYIELPENLQKLGHSAFR